MASAPPLRVGIVPYLNMLPLVHGLDRFTLDGQSLDVVSLPPSQMAARMEAGELDLGMIPVAAMFDHPDWRIVGRSMIGSEGPVKSVIAIAGEAPEEWTQLHPDSQSRTSNALIQILLHHEFGVRPELVQPVPLGDWIAPRKARPGEAFLLIGSRALRWRNQWKGDEGARLDLGEVWTNWTGLPFVYALWVARPGVEVGNWMDAFEKLKQENMANLRAVVESRSNQEDDKLTADEACKYLTENIVFDVDRRSLSGLERFYEEGVQLKLFKPGWELSRALAPSLELPAS